MIFIVVRFTVKSEHRDEWLDRVRPFTEATRGEPGNLWFDWSRSVDDPDEFVLVEAFRDADAGADHVSNPHFQAGLDTMRPMLATTPDIINVDMPGDGWSRMAELELDD
ncbi:putative quinol monooxygenase [Solicola gregarius]|uniref:Antibiotic biosynthesis monooxygenase n=1 Tax=Solicola gregarius TaxID=2908642 RepID=A0AA46TJR8_9ACTN|nr:putative quinol monooxygenase [Solicola gregarius]UYM06408.1 antibiotic biosynthesis monooxygenase [Solicola gregarius]